MQEDETFYELAVEEREIEVKAYFEETDKPFVTSNELASHFDTDRDTVYRTLENLLKSGYFQKERVGAGGVVYYKSVSNLCE